MKKAIKLGFGFALGAYLFSFAKAGVDFVIDKCFEKRLNKDEGFREHIKVTSPELYAKFRKENKQ